MARDRGGTDSDARRWWLRDGAVAAAYLAIGLVLFAPVLGAFFLSDDFFYLDAIVHSHWPDVLALQPGVFRPLHVVSWLVDYRLWGLNPVGYHLTNVVSHGLTAFLVFVLARHLVGPVVSEPTTTWTSVLAGLVFLFQPSHTEAVSWIIGRHDVLATFFLLGSWLTYAQFRDGARPAWLGCSLLAFAIALLFKESVLTFPLVLVAYESWRLLLLRPLGGRWSVSTLRVPALYFAVIAAYLLVRRVVSGDLVAGYELAFIRPSATAIFANLAATVLRSFFPYVPVQLLPQVPRIGLSSAGVVVAGFVGAMAGIALIYKTWTRPTPARLLVGFLAVALLLSALPTVAGAPSLIDSEGERYAYLPSVFASIVVAFLVTTLAKTRAARAGVSAAVLLILAAFLELSNQNWRAAGELTQGILASLQAQPSGQQAAILLVPDSLNGAFIFRNGLEEAEELFGTGAAARLSPAGWVFLKHADEVISLDRMDSSHYTLSIPGDRGALRLVPGAPYPALTATSISPFKVDVVAREHVRVAYFSGGQMTYAELAPQ